MLRNMTRRALLANRLEVARGPVRRAVGLLGRPALPAGEALLLPACGSIHMFFMRFAIDAIFLDGYRDGRARCLAVARDLAPWRLGPWVRGARAVVELPAGAAGGTAPGDELGWED